MKLFQFKRNSRLSRLIGFMGLGLIVLIMLKLFGLITWPWLWILSPIWIQLAIFFLIFFGTLAFGKNSNGK